MLTAHAQASRAGAYRQLVSALSAYMSQVLDFARSDQPSSELLQAVAGAASAAAHIVTTLTAFDVQQLAAADPKLPGARAVLARTVRAGAWLWRQALLQCNAEERHVRECAESLAAMVYITLIGERQLASVGVSGNASSSSSCGVAVAALDCAVALAADNEGEDWG